MHAYQMMSLIVAPVWIEQTNDRVKVDFLKPLGYGALYSGWSCLLTSTVFILHHLIVVVNGPG